MLITPSQPKGQCPSPTSHNILETLIPAQLTTPDKSSKTQRIRMSAYVTIYPDISIQLQRNENKDQACHGDSTVGSRLSQCVHLAHHGNCAPSDQASPFKHTRSRLSHHFDVVVFPWILVLLLFPHYRIMVST